MVSDAQIEIARKAMNAANKRIFGSWPDKETGEEIVREMFAALEAASSVQAPEPVAWRYRKPYPNDGWTDWLLSSKDPRWHEPAAEVQPLYAAPQAPAGKQ